MKKLTSAMLLGAALMGLAATSAFAANKPTRAQCEKGWDSSMEWTQDQFTKACADLEKM